MKRFLIRSQVLFTSIVLLFAFGLMMAIVTRHNARWDFTKEKFFSLSEPTSRLLKKMAEGKIEVLAFYPSDDPAREFFEVFLKQCGLEHLNFKYNFYDADRVPSLANRFHVKEHYTVILRYAGRQERVARPTEESFTNALLRLANPKRFELCFATGHDEASIAREDRGGYRLFRQALEDNNYSVHEIIMPRDKVPSNCNVLVMAGPHRDLDAEEYGLLKKIFAEGRGIFFLIDPMDPGMGKSFRFFMKDFGVVLGEDVIVDKMSRVVGGDFLVPMVSQYITKHPVTADFDKPTFFPVARSVQPSTEIPKGLEVVPLGLTTSGSWAERNLATLEQGQAAFEPASDVAGPIPLAAAVEREDAPPNAGGRMVVVGDSDFLTNAYLDLSGNKDLALNMIQWLSKDDRFLSIHAPAGDFKPLLMNQRQRWILLGVTIGLIPFSCLLAGAIRIYVRARAK